jgi:hypothetical protein
MKRFSEKDLVVIKTYSKMDRDEYADALKIELDHLDFLEITGRHKKRIEYQRKKVQLIIHAGEANDKTENL